MNLLILNASPKKKGGASRFFSGVLRRMLPGVHTKTLSLHNRGDFKKALEQLSGVDAVCFSLPLYVDGLPSHLVEFLKIAEEHCKTHRCQFRVYGLLNNGFVEGRQNKPALHMLQAWCERSGLTWGGGVGIGGGVMLHALGIIYSILLTAIVLYMGVSYLTTGIVADSLWLTLWTQICVWLFLNIGMLFCMGRLAIAIRKRGCLPNQFTRVMIPGFVFLVFADLFMVFSSLFRGRFVFRLLKKDSWPG